jgi:hypothetical protein
MTLSAPTAFTASISSELLTKPRTFAPRFASSGTTMPANLPAAPMANIKGGFSDIINLSGLPVTGPSVSKRV